MATTTSRRRSLSLPPFPTLSFFGSRAEAKAAKAAKAEAKAKAEAEAKAKIAEARGRAQARGRADTELKEAAAAAATAVADLKARETEVMDAHPRLRRKLQKVSKQKGENDLGGSDHGTLSVQRLDDSFLSIRYDGKSSASRSSTSSTISANSKSNIVATKNTHSGNATANTQETDSKAAMIEQQKRTMALVQAQEAEARAKEQAEMATSDVSVSGVAQPVRTFSHEMPRGRRRPPPLMVPQQYPQIHHPQLKHHSLTTEMVNGSSGETGWAGCLHHSPHKPASLASNFSASVASSAPASARHSMMASMASLTSTATSTTTMAPGVTGGPGGSGGPGGLSPAAYAHAYAKAYTHAYSRAQAMNQGKAMPPSPPLSPPGSSSSSVSSSSVFLSGHSHSRSHSSSNSSVSNFSDLNAPPGYGHGGKHHQSHFRGDRHSFHVNVVPELSHLSRERQHVDAAASTSDSPDSGTTQPRRKAKTPVYSIGQLEDNKGKQLETATMVTATGGMQTPPDSPLFVGVASAVSGTEPVGSTGPGHVRAKSSIECIAEEYRALLVSRNSAFTDADDSATNSNGNADTEADAARARANMTPAPLVSRQRQFLLSTPKKEHVLHSSPSAQNRYEKAGSVSTSSSLPSPLLSPISMPRTSQLPQTPRTPQTLRGRSPVDNLSLQMCTDLLTRELSAAITDRKAPKAAVAATAPALQVLVMIEAYERLRDQLVADAHKDDTAGIAAQTEAMLSVWLQSLYRIHESLTQEDGAYGRRGEWDDCVSESLYDSVDE